MAGNEVSRLVNSMKSIDVDSVSSEERATLQDAAKTLLDKSSSAFDFCFRLCWEQSSLVTALRICTDLDLFRTWVEHGGQDMTSIELSEIMEAKCDPDMLERLLRLIAASSVVKVIPPNKYGLTPLSRSFSDPRVSATIRFAHTFWWPGFINLPKFLSDTNYRNPTDPKATNFGATWKYQGTAYDYFEENPAFGFDFNLVMQFYQTTLVPWTEIFPTEQLLPTEEQDKASPILVDVGGGTGQHTIQFAKKHHVPRESLLIQDRPEVVATTIASQYAECQAHDFFTPQPVHGARSYFFSNILHNWSDEQAKQILANIKPAMTPGKSKILIFEVVLRPDEPGRVGPVLDMIMMGFLSAEERSYDKWKSIVEPVGLKISKVHYHPSSAHAVLEVDVA